MSTVVALKKQTKAMPNIEKRKVRPRRLSNKELRNREYLTPGEVARLLKAAGRLGRHGHRDETLLLLASHGLQGL
jgi:hypothetical protein